MRRPLATAALAAALALPTLAVVWAGLGWPPPLWIVEYGLPGTQGPTGRVALVDGHRYHEIPAGYYSFASPAGAGALPTRQLAPLGVVAPSPRYRSSREWREVVRPFWGAFGFQTVSREDLGADDPTGLRRLCRSTGLPFRSPTETETYVLAGMGLQPEGEFSSPVPLSRIPFLFTDFPVFSLGPGEEPLVEPYLVEGN